MFDTENAACTGMTREELLPCAFCVQRFGNWMILQLIPLIALCCVLQRNRKPSHPSRHVVGAVLVKRVFFLSLNTSGKKILICELQKRTDLFAEKVFFKVLWKSFGKMIQLQVHLQLPCYDFCFLYWRNIGELSSKWNTRQSDHLYCTIIGNNDGRCVQMAGT